MLVQVSSSMLFNLILNSYYQFSIQSALLTTRSPLRLVQNAVDFTRQQLVAVEGIYLCQTAPTAVEEMMLLIVLILMLHVKMMPMLTVSRSVIV